MGRRDQEISGSWDSNSGPPEAQWRYTVCRHIAHEDIGVTDLVKFFCNSVTKSGLYLTELILHVTNTYSRFAVDEKGC